jgi:hypothetical protein
LGNILTFHRLLTRDVLVMAFPLTAVRVFVVVVAVVWMRLGAQLKSRLKSRLKPIKAPA